MKIKNLWNVKVFPLHYVVEKENGELYMFFITPFRKIEEKDLVSYKGHHPSLIAGGVAPSYMLTLYGLAK